MFKSKLKHIISYILHGESKPVYAKISYLSPCNRLNGKRIIITGGGRGLGFYMAKKFTAEGAVVLIAGRNEEKLKESAECLDCMYLRLDVQDISSFNAFIRNANKMLGGIDCLVNNAGISLHEKSIFDVSESMFDEQISTNLRGPYFLSKEFMEHCKGEGHNSFKKILFLSSETGDTMDERPYGLTKSAINSLVQGLAHKYVNEGFRINAIAPGVTLSDMVGLPYSDNIARSGGITGRYYLPEEVAEIACFLLCDASNCINGQILVCNEGRTINARWK